MCSYKVYLTVTILIKTTTFNSIYQLAGNLFMAFNCLDDLITIPTFTSVFQFALVLPFICALITFTQLEQANAFLLKILHLTHSFGRTKSIKKLNKQSLQQLSSFKY